MSSLIWISSPYGLRLFGPGKGTGGNWEILLKDFAPKKNSALNNSLPMSIFIRYTTAFCPFPSRERREGCIPDWRRKEKFNNGRKEKQEYSYDSADRIGGIGHHNIIRLDRFFNPMDNMNTVEKPELALSSLKGADVNLLPEKSAEELLLDGLQKGEETPLIMDEEQGDIQISMDEPPEEEKVPAVAVKPAETKPVPKVTYKDVTEDIYWLQVGSFPNSVSADNLRAFLKARGIDSVMQTREVNGTLYYRVRVGAFSEKGEAEAFKEKLIALKEIEEVTLYTDKITKSVPVN